MKTEITPITELQPGDEIFIPWPEDKIKPEWWKIPDVVTVKEVFANTSTVTIKESGGLCLNAQNLCKVINPNQPKAKQLTIF